MSGCTPETENPIRDFRDVCAAAATPPGQSGLAVIRLSGPGSAVAAALLFVPAGPGFLPVSEMTGYTCSFGKIIDPVSGKMLDEAIVTRFTAPRSYTGEDMIE